MEKKADRETDRLIRSAEKMKERLEKQKKIQKTKAVR